MKLHLDVDCKTREAAVAALRLAIKHVQEFQRTDKLNVGEGMKDFDYVLKWSNAPVAAALGTGTGVVVLKPPVAGKNS